MYYFYRVRLKISDADIDLNDVGQNTDIGRQEMRKGSDGIDPHMIKEISVIGRDEEARQRRSFSKN